MPFQSFGKFLVYIAFVIVSVLVGPSISMAKESLIVYSGRAERLIKPVLDAFEAESGISIQMLTADSTALVNRLNLEGSRTTADILLTNDAGALERARELHLLQAVDIPGIETAIPSTFRASDNSWIGLSGRIWVMVYNTTMVKPSEISSILDLAQPKWKGKVAIPTAGSEYLQTGVSVIREIKGEAMTKQFLKGLKENAGTSVFGKNRQIVAAVARGEVAVGLVNHYYISRHLAKHPDAPIAQLLPDQEKQGMGVVLNAAGVGITAQSKHLAQAKALVQFLISPKGQKMFANSNKEYPLNTSVDADPGLRPLKSFQVAQVPLARLSELRDPTMTVIEHVGLR
ncbi:extracellular solute-binding protein [Candidatus Nitronereus thalassa]|uniref:Extracellular solute-binding protein n=1 Tax=Candidatus Nitronereus thalassa TaxID=3020898 RepID=A0ABU3K356_9BACT|nr:extracellular solute-binding protein [Candidatus Nitronereus thalassa]MDT7040820.1 extracellular solute-binding protein [Candidatus Nitronereus thalassa]